MNAWVTWLYFLLAVCSMTAHAQDFSIKEIETNNNGGSVVAKKTLFLDQDGFLWYSTRDGIIKEHGTNTIFFAVPNSSDVLDPPQIYQIYKSRKNILWLATSQGVYALDLDTGEGHWIVPTIPNYPKNVDIFSVFEDSVGDIWLATELDYIFKISPNREVIRIRLDKSPYLKILGDVPVNTFLNSRIKFEGTHGSDYMVISQAGVLSQVNVHTLEQEVLVDFNDKSRVETHKDWLVMDNHSGLEPTSLGYYAYGGRSYAFSYIDEINKFYVEVPNESKNNAFLEGKETTVFLVKNRGKELIYSSFQKNDKGQFFLSDDHKITLGHEILDTFIDVSGTVLVNTQDGKISFIKKNPSKFKKYLQGDGNESISCRGLFENSKGDILIYTYKGFYQRRKGEEHFEKLDQLPSSITSTFHSFYMENDSIIWGYGYSSYLHRLNILDNTFQSFNNKSIFYRRIDYRHAQILGDYLYLQGNRGLYGFNIRTQKFDDLNQLTKDIDITNVEIKEIFIDSKKNNLWIGTLNGIYGKNLSTNEVHYFNTDTRPIQLVNNEVNVIFEDRQGFIWLGTDSGLQKIDTVHWTTEVFPNTPFKNNKITGIVEEGANLWIGTFDGLIKFDRENKLSQVFLEEDGLTNNEFNFRSYLKTREGEVFFGSIDGLVGFYPNEITKAQDSIMIFLNQYKLYSKANDSIKSNYLKVSEASTFTMPYNHNYLSLQFAMNDIFNKDENRYQYRLVDESEDWLAMGNKGNLQFQGLKPGNHLLEVRGMSPNGTYTNTLQYEIVSKEIFYRSKPFIIGVSLFVLFSLLLFNHSQQQKVRKNLEQKIKMMQLESRAFRAQMNPHFISNVLNGIQSVMTLKGELEANRYINNFSKVLRHTLNISNFELIPINEEIEYLKSYIELEKFRLNHQLEVNFKLKNRFNANVMVPCMLFQPIIENAVVHGLMPKDGNKLLDITFEIRDNYIIGTILDNGIGIEKSKNRKTGEGNKKISWATTILHERIEIFNSLNPNKISLTIEDRSKCENTNGTKVVISIPLLYNNNSLTH